MNQFRPLDIDLYFRIRVMRVSGVDIFAGESNPEQRQQAIADTITQYRLHDTPINSRGKIETWATAYARLYGKNLEPLTTTAPLDFSVKPASTPRTSTPAGESRCTSTTHSAA